ncbi:MAG TPA: YIP1 family protein [Vicinamibacteria bacterium]|nr:YIP1 family protein [Vicinamibacteria bacterium]
MDQCPKCGALIASRADRYCLNCGAELPQETGGLPPLPPPPPSGAAAGARPRDTPWERRAELGFVPAVFDTIKGVLGSPAEFFRAMPKEGGIGSPLGYGVLVGYVGVLVTAVYNALMNTLIGSTLAELGERGPFGRLAPYLEGGIGLVSQVVFGPIWILIGIFLGAGIYHVVLLILGEARQSFETTFRVVCYGQSCAILQIVPFCGGFLTVIAWIVVGIIGLSEAHGIGRGSAAVAVLAPIVFCCCCCGAAIALFVGGIGGLAGMRH